jgi:Rrf2 family protein
MSAKVEYACMAMIELAICHNLGQPVRQRMMSERHGIPSQFLVQILQQLRTAGLIASTRGAAGGYQLTRSPDLINLWDIVCAVGSEGETSPPNVEGTPMLAAIRLVWKEIDEERREILRRTTLAHLAQRVSGQGPMYYI